MYHPGRLIVKTMIGPLAALCGCATSAPSRFYILSAIPTSRVAEKDNHRDLSIVLASVTLAQFHQFCSGPGIKPTQGGSRR